MKLIHVVITSTQSSDPDPRFNSKLPVQRKPYTQRPTPAYPLPASAAPNSNFQPSPIDDSEEKSGRGVFQTLAEVRRVTEPVLEREMLLCQCGPRPSLTSKVTSNHRPHLDSQKYCHFPEPSIPGGMGRGGVTAVGGRARGISLKKPRGI